MNIVRNLLATASLGLAIGLAQAATVSVTFDNPIFNGTPSPGFDVVKITYPKAGGGTTTTSVHAGRLQGTAHDLDGVSPEVFVDGLDDLFLYCYDLHETIRGGQTVRYTVVFDGESARTLDFLGAVNAVLNAERGSDDVFAWLHPASTAEAAAIQLGIWESRYDAGPWDLGSGTFSATHLRADTASRIAGFFAAIPGAPSLDARFAMVLQATGAQDMLVGDPPPRTQPPAPASTPVPLPGTLALVLLGAWALRRVTSAARTA